MLEEDGSRQVVLDVGLHELKRLQEFLTSRCYTYQSNAPPSARIESDVDTYSFCMRNSIPFLANQALSQLQINLRRYWPDVCRMAKALIYSPERRHYRSLRQVLVRVAYELGAHQGAQYTDSACASADFFEDLQEQWAYQNMLAVPPRRPCQSPPAVWYSDELSRRVEANGPSNALWGFLRAARDLLQRNPEDGWACISAIWRVVRPWEFEPQLESRTFVVLSLLALLDSESSWEYHASRLVLLLQAQLPPVYRCDGMPEQEA
ncbi:hypothetical protein BDV24DRAFT_170321 [Aspergillus arachidicola]|uniref:Uncharacterized protein n=1 Tax=Aspergillus arachidicola TaxID=656916 RepID=A0A5N6XMZ0_9EURO|nr:hypothetical protein BDV24DRAFT_170321 [Aspergillus arachidicola]